MADFSQFKLADENDFSQFQAADEPQEPQDDTGLPISQKIAQGINVGLAKGFGAPVDLANFALGFFGLGSGQPVGGSRSLQAGLSTAGIAPPPGEEREQLGAVGRVAEEVGATVAPVGALGAAARAGRTGGTILKPVMDFFKQRPGTFVATEAGAATTAGIGAAFANEIFPGNELADITGQLVGGIASPQTLITERAPQFIQNVRRATKVLTTKEGAFDVASEIAKRSVKDREKVIAQLSGEPDILPGLTPAKETGDPFMLSLERSAMKKSEELKDGIAESIANVNRSVVSEMDRLRGTGSVEAAKIPVQDKVDYLKDLLTVRSQQAVNAASDKLSRLRPNTPREKANTIVRKELDDAYEAARLQEKELWDNVPSEIPASVENTRTRFAEILRKRDRKVDNPEDIPDFLRKIFSGKGAVKGEQRLGRVHRIRSRVLEAERLERAKDAPNRNKMRILGELADSLLDDMAVAASDEINLARSYSRDFNQRFRQGTVGDILGFAKTGEPELPAALTLERTVGRTGPAGGVGVEDITRATGVQATPQDTGFQVTQDAIRDFVADRFIRKFPDGEVNPRTGKAFLQENAQVLARNPDLKTEIEQAISSQESAQRYVASQQKTERLLSDKRKTAASIFLDAPVGQEVKAILSSKNPQAAMKSLVKRSVKDKSGEAIAGLRAATIDEVSNFLFSGRRDIGQELLPSGERFNRFINSNKAALSEVLSKTQMADLDRVRRTVLAMERKAGAGFPGQRIIDESPDQFTDLVLSVVGANLGGASAAARASGAGLVIAGRTAGAARDIGRKWISRIPAGKGTEVLNEAVLNRDLMRELLKRPKTIEAAIENQRALRGFLINIIPEAFADGKLEIVIERDASDFEEQ